MTHFHPQSPDYPCPADNDDRPEDLAAYRAVEKAGRMKDGCSTTAAFRIFTAYREALYGDGKFPQGKHWNGPEMRYHVTAADRAAERESRVGIGHKMGLVHSGRDWCDDPKCEWCTPSRPCPPGETYVCKYGRTHTWHRSCPGCVVA
jgi:hypothetical protein